MTAQRFAANLAFLMASIFVWYAVMMTVFATVEGGVTADEYANGLRPTVAQEVPNGPYLPRVN